MTNETHTLVDFDYSLLCRQCQELPRIDDYHDIDHTIHDNLEELESCPCSFCTWLWDSICACTTSEDIQRYKKETSSSTWPVELHLQLRGGRSEAYLMTYERNFLLMPLYTTPEDSDLEYVSGRSLAADLKSDQALQRIKGWLKYCTEEHDHDDNVKHESCADPSIERPTLLLDVGLTEDTHLRLVENNEAATASYVALSYVWGVVPEELKKMYLNTGNKNEYLNQIPESDLPQTIQDAIFVTRWLEIPFLWVDALCIFQDDKNLKDKEILKMHDIYTGSYLTIQAACTSAVMDPFLIERERHALPDQRLRYSQNGSTNKTQFIYMRPAELASKQGGLVETRAWCFEESFLPKRLLVMAKAQMSYSCGKGTAWEGDRRWVATDTRSQRQPAPKPWHTGLQPKRVPHSIRTPNSRLDSLRLWYDILVLDYTPRIVTNDIDRLRAIAGIAKVIQKHNRQIGAYQAGLWMGDLPWGLLWSTQRLQVPAFLKPEIESAWRNHYKKDLMFRASGTEARCRAPSWSWASVIGPIHCDFVARFAGKLLLKELVRLPSGNDFLGKKEDWEIILDAPIKRVHVSSVLRTRAELETKKKTYGYLGIRIPNSPLYTVLSSVPEVGGLPDHFGLAKFDVAEEEAEKRGHSVLCVFICEESGLIVEPTCTEGTGEVKYQRLGTFVSWCDFYEGESITRVTLV